jgi:hypothetical protein
VNAFVYLKKILFIFKYCFFNLALSSLTNIIQIITLSDLECDYLNAQECCNKLNFVSIFYLIQKYTILFFELKKLLKMIKKANNILLF